MISCTVVYRYIDNQLLGRTHFVGCFPFHRFRLLIQMEETQRTLDEFWNKHASHLRLCLQLRQFELDFRELQVSERLTAMKVTLKTSRLLFVYDVLY